MQNQPWCAWPLHSQATIFLFLLTIIGFNSFFEIIGTIFILKSTIIGIGWYVFISAETLALSTTISAWKIFCSIRSSKLSDTAPSNIPWPVGGTKAEFTKSFEKNCIYQEFLRNSHISCAYGLLNLACCLLLSYKTSFICNFSCILIYPLI